MKSRNKVSTFTLTYIIDYVLKIGTWEFSPMNTIGRPQSVHDGTSVAVMEVLSHSQNSDSPYVHILDFPFLVMSSSCVLCAIQGDGVRAALFLGESRWKRVRIVSARVDTGFSPLQTKAFKRLFRIGIGVRPPRLAART